MQPGATPDGLSHYPVPTTKDDLSAHGRPKARDLLKQSYAILKSDKELVLFPIYSAVFSLLAMAVVGGLYAAVRWGGMHGNQNTGIDYLFLFILYVACYYVVIYFNAGLAACVLYRFQGNDPTFSYGRAQASKHHKEILEYALLAAIVGLILRVIAERFKLVGQIVANILGAMWSIATIFIAPVLVTTELSPMDAVKESARIFKATWGNTVKGTVSFFFIGMLGFVICIIPFLLGITIGGAGFIFGGLIISVLAFIALSIILSTCTSIYRTALFHYATTQKVPQGFTPGLAAAVR
jgi:hypothetical protein